ncbi:MAG: hypothetical protein K0Q95_2396 [Bacteroidota bacterium]|nr:hypothetical protein [Bacteroidota bacterium]
MLIVFGGLILLPAFNHYFEFIYNEPGNENRAKSKRPELNLSNLDAFVKNYDNYYTDNFSLRQNAISLHNRFEYFTFGVSPVPGEVVVGKDGWFYDKDCIDNYKGSNVFTPEQLGALKNELAYRCRWAKERGLQYYTVVVPSKMNVYPEYLPDNIIKVSETSRYEQIVSLNNIEGINVVDVRRNLLKNKNANYDLFQKTDGHWNDLGAYYGYEEIINRLAEQIPEMNAVPLSDYNIGIEKQMGGSIVKMINLEKEYPEEFVRLTEKEPVSIYDGPKRAYSLPEGISAEDHQIIKLNDKAKLKCLVIRDSFTLLLVKFLSRNFHEAVFIHDAWKYRMREDLIETEKPHVILNIVFETGLEKLLQYSSHKAKRQ